MAPNYPLNANANGERLRGIMAFGSQAVILPAGIANGQSLSEAIILDSAGPVRLMMPAAFDGGYVEFQVSADGVTFTDLYDDVGSKVRITAAPATAVRLTPADWLGIYAIKIRSVTGAGAAQAQGAARSIGIVVVP